MKDKYKVTSKVTFKLKTFTVMKDNIELHTSTTIKLKLVPLKYASKLPIHIYKLLWKK